MGTHSGESTCTRKDPSIATERIAKNVAAVAVTPMRRMSGPAMKRVPSTAAAWAGIMTIAVCRTVRP